MTGRPPGSLQRALLQLAVGDKRAELAKQLNEAPRAGGDFVQHIKVNLEGVVDSNPIDIMCKFAFPLPFMYAPNQSEAGMPEPHFNYGIESPPATTISPHAVATLPSTDSSPRPSIEPHLKMWIVSDEVWFLGAVIRVSAYIPFAPKLTPFKAVLHLTFFGYAAHAEEIDNTNG